MEKSVSKAIENASGNSKSYWLPMLIIGALFFIFGFVTWLNGTLIQFLQTACELTPFEASLVTLAFYIAYFFMALPSSFVLRRTGYKNGMALGLIIMAIGSVIFIPAAYSRMFGVFLTGLFVMGTGLALLQTAVNPYVTIIGPNESAAARISIMGICNKLAGFISPLVLTALVMHGMDKYTEDKLSLLDQIQKNAALNELAARLVGPYIIMAIALVLLGVMIKFSALPNKLDIDEDPDDSLAGFIKEIPQALKIPHLTLGFIGLFLYVGIEVIAGDSIGQYGKNLGLEFAPKLTSFTMAFMVIGYIIGIVLIPKYVKQATALRFSAIFGLIFSAGAIFSDEVKTNVFNSLFGWLNSIGLNIPVLPNSIFFVALLGLANALMWPSFWPLILNDLGKFTKMASALLVMGIIGGALIPPAYVALSQKIGFQPSLWIAIPIYLYILYYAVQGYKTGLKGNHLR
ncbi:MAG TPA: sugar MFS transporter [Bacteroidales bacterium]|nr:sugar MFS transporter [Bacteroidales bacterium]